MTSPDDRTSPYAPGQSTAYTPTPAYPVSPVPQQPYPYPTNWQPPLQPAGPPPTPAGKPRRGKLLIAGLIAAVLLIAAAVGVYLLTRDVGGLSEQTAQRECRTALEQEATRRVVNLGSTGTTEIVVTVKHVDVQETYETETGYAVNGTVAYTLTTGLLPQVEQQVSLTCTATGSGDSVNTTVTNRS